MALSPEELKELMQEAHAERGVLPCFPGTNFPLKFHEQKSALSVLALFETLKVSKNFAGLLLASAMELAGAKGVQAEKGCFARFCSIPLLVEVDSQVKKYILKFGLAVYHLRSRQGRLLDVLVRNFDKNAYAEVFMTFVREFFPDDLQALVEFINAMPAKSVLQEEGYAVEPVSAEDPFRGTILGFEGLSPTCCRESFGILQGAVHIDYSRGQQNGFVRFDAPHFAETAFITASNPSFLIEDVHPVVRRLTNEECEAYRQGIEEMKLRRKNKDKGPKH
jgi:RNA binding motif